jgi:hypothetical protein
MTSQKDIRSKLDQLLAATPEEHARHATEEALPLPDPGDLVWEENLVQALYTLEEAKAEVADTPTTNQDGAVWWQWMIRPWAMGPVLVASCMLFFFRGTLFPPKETFTCKGAPEKCAPPLKTQHVTLHLGIWTPTQKTLKRAGHGTHCTTQQNVSFGFTIQEKPGHLYLFVYNSHHQLELLYSPKERGGKPWSVGFSNLTHNNQTQYYGLENEKGKVQFTVLYTQQTLSPKQLSTLLQGPGQQLPKRLNGLKASTTSPQHISFEQMTIFVGKKL